MIKIEPKIEDAAQPNPLDILDILNNANKRYINSKQ